MRRLILISLLIACGEEAAPPYEPPPIAEHALPDPAAVDAALSGLSFREFVDQSFDHLLRRSPETVAQWNLQEVVSLDIPRLNDRRPAFIADTHEIERTILRRLDAFDTSEFNEQDLLLYDAYRWYVDDRVSGQAFWEHAYPVTGIVRSDLGRIEGALSDLPENPDAADVRDYINLLWQVSGAVEALRDRIVRCDERQIRPPTFVIDWALSVVGNVAFQPPSDTVYFRSLSNLVDSASGEDGPAIDELRREGEFVIEGHIQPAYDRLHAVLEELRGRSSYTLGVDSLPNGAAFYQHLIQHHTTSTVTAAGLHAAGQTDLDRIHAELADRFSALGLSSDLDLRTAFEQVGIESGIVPAADVLQGYIDLVEAAEARLGEAFDLLPSQPVEVVSHPTGGFYIRSSLLRAEPGRFFAGTADDQPAYAMASLAYHEALPGHHLQVGLETDLGLALFQRLTSFTGYREGWALYAEALAEELGWYADDPYGDIGRLQWEALRAARLVVDTGIHAFGWSFERSVDYLDDNLGFDPAVLSSQGQTGRYASWPGQALAYKSGMLEIQALRAYAEAQLGSDFDLVAFHRVVLSTGPVPMTALKTHVRRWVDAQAGQ